MKPIYPTNYHKAIWPIYYGKYWALFWGLDSLKFDPGCNTDIHFV